MEEHHPSPSSPGSGAAPAPAVQQQQQQAPAAPAWAAVPRRAVPEELLVKFGWRQLPALQALGAVPRWGLAAGSLLLIANGDGYERVPALVEDVQLGGAMLDIAMDTAPAPLSVQGKQLAGQLIELSAALEGKLAWAKQGVIAGKTLQNHLLAALVPIAAALQALGNEVGAAAWTAGVRQPALELLALD